MTRPIKTTLFTLGLILTSFAAAAQGTAFTYQGRMFDGTNPANGKYDLRFNLFDAVSAGSLVAGPKTNTAVALSNGLFTVTLDFGAGIFTGPSRFLEIAARSNTVAVAFTVLTPRQELTPTPYAITAENLDGLLPASQLTGTLPSGVLCGTFGCPLSFTNLANSFSGNGAGLVNVNAATLGGLGPNSFWKTLGNAGTSPTNGNFVGTTDNEPLEVRVNNVRGFRVEADPVYSTPNVIGGSMANFVTPGYVGNFIGAGSQAGFASNYISGGNLNTIGGGWDNHITNGYDSTIGGGQYNTIGASSGSATIPGGYRNVATGDYSFAAGQNAQALHDGAFVWADDSTSTPFASASANQFLVRSSFMGLNRNTRLSANEYFGIFAPVSNTWVGMYIQGQTSSKPFYGYNNPSGTAWTELDGADANKWKLYNFGYQLAVTTSGQVGIGTMSPTDKLDVEGTVRVNDNAIYLRGGGDRNHGISYWNQLVGQTIDGPLIWGYNGGALGGVTTNTNPDVITLRWDWLGNVWISNNCSVATLSIRGGADLAEPFQMSDSSKEIPQGAVVVIDEDNPGHLKLSDQAYDTRVAGVVSGAKGINPGIQMQQQGLLEGGKNVALTGRVYVQADATFGAIKPGDMLTTSSTPGHAMKVTNHSQAQGAILGKAMTGLKEGRGMVLVLVTLQ